MKIAELKKETFYILPIETKFQGAPFDTIYVDDDKLLFISSEHYKVNGASLKELFNSKKDKK